MSEQGRPAVIENILDIEERMFLAVPSRGPAPCRENPAGMRMFRGAQFQTWSGETLASYLDDLLEAERLDRNLMTLKYARMENLIPPLTANPLVGRMVDAQAAWYRGLIDRFPRFMRTARPLGDGLNPDPGASFRSYLAGELETYSDRTLALLNKDVTRMHEKGRNMVEEVFTHVIRGMGFESLEETERLLAEREKKESA